MARNKIAVLTVGPDEEPLAELVLVDGQPVLSRDANGEISLFTGEVAQVVIDGHRAEALGAFRWWQEVYAMLTPEEVLQLGSPLAVLDPLEALQALLEWNETMGFWENPVWDRARIVLDIYRACNAWPREPLYYIRSDEGFWSDTSGGWVDSVSEATLYQDRQREGRRLPDGDGVTWIRQGAGEEPYVPPGVGTDGTQST